MTVHGWLSDSSGPHGGAYRPAVTGANGVVASAHYLASLAGVRMLLAGGNAVDAAVATAATLNVVEPYMSGIGGCGYMMLFSARTAEHLALDYMGTAPSGTEHGRIGGPLDLYDSPKGTLVPGALAGWLTALERFGTMDRKTVFAPAIEYAERGFPVSARNSTFFTDAGDRVARWKGANDYLANGHVPRHGEVIVQKNLARTYRQIVEGGKDAFYRGEPARAIGRASELHGGFVTEQDLANLTVAWHKPIEIGYRGYRVRTVPPPCSGIQYLIDLGILEGFDLASLGHNSAEHLHLFAEATKLAVADRIAYTAIPDPPVQALLARDYLAGRRALIDPRRAAVSGGERFSRRAAAGQVGPGSLAGIRSRSENTTHFSVVDREGNAVSVTQSLGGAFGCGIVAGETGVAMNNLGFWMDLDPESPNCIGPNKKAEMCMSPCHVLKDGKVFLAIGTPGGIGILQTTPQMISNVIDFGLNVQAAIEAPRIRCALPNGEDHRFFEIGGPDPATLGSLIRMEDRIGLDVKRGLEARGHTVELIGAWTTVVGGGQGVLVDPETGARSGGADPRRDGYAIAY